MTHGEHVTGLGFQLNLCEGCYFVVVAKVEQSTHVSVFVAASKQSVTARNGKRGASRNRDLPGLDDLMISQVDEREISVVVEPDVVLGFDIERVAVADRIQRFSGFKLIELLSLGTPRDQSALTDRSLPTEVAENAFVEVAGPNHTGGRRLH